MKTEHVVIGAAAVGALALAYHFHMIGGKGKHAFYGSAGSKIQHRPGWNDGIYAARLARKGGMPIKDSGITNVGQLDSGGVGWHATGYNARNPQLNPSAWSNLTARNENYTYAHTPTNRLLRPAGAGRIPHMRLQGATGLTRYLPGIQYTYW